MVDGDDGVGGDGGGGDGGGGEGGGKASGGKARPTGSVGSSEKRAKRPIGQQPNKSKANLFDSIQIDLTKKSTARHWLSRKLDSGEASIFIFYILGRGASGEVSA